MTCHRSSSINAILRLFLNRLLSMRGQGLMEMNSHEGGFIGLPSTHTDFYLIIRSIFLDLLRRRQTSETGLCVNKMLRKTNINFFLSCQLYILTLCFREWSTITTEITSVRTHIAPTDHQKIIWMKQINSIISACEKGTAPMECILNTPEIKLATGSSVIVHIAYNQCGLVGSCYIHA